MQRVIVFLAASALLVSIVQAKPHFPLSYSAFSSPSEFAAFNSYYPNYFYDSYPLTSPTLKTYSTRVVHQTHTAPTVYSSYPSSFGYFEPSFYNFHYNPPLPSSWDTRSFDTPSFGTPGAIPPCPPGAHVPSAPENPGQETPNFGTRFGPKDVEPMTVKPGKMTTPSSTTAAPTTVAPNDSDTGDGLEKLDTKVNPVSNKIDSKNDKKNKDDFNDNFSFDDSA